MRSYDGVALIESEPSGFPPLLLDDYPQESADQFPDVAAGNYNREL
jgi:hypothetical protein